MNKKQTVIHNEMLDQLKMLGFFDKAHEDLVKDYISLISVKDALLADIGKRGAICSFVSSVGVERVGNNPSVKELLAVNKQMLAILKEIGLSPDKYAGLRVGDDEM